MKPGTLKCAKAIGWYIDEYGIAQVSMNITNINVTPLHKAFDEVCRCAQNRGVRVTGTEIVGLVPERTLLEAGRYFLAKQQRSAGIPKKDILNIAIKSLGLSDLKEFKPEEKIIEYVMAEGDEKQHLLVDMTVKGFAEETSRESPAPGGGSVSAYMGALGASLATMVANLSSHKPGWDEQWSEFAAVAEEGMALQEYGSHTDGYALCYGGAAGDDEGFVRGVCRMPQDGGEGQSQQRVGCRSGSVGCTCRCARCRYERED